MAASVQHTRATSSARKLRMLGVVVGGDTSVLRCGPTSPSWNLTYLAALSVRVQGEIRCYVWGLLAGCRRSWSAAGSSTVILRLSRSVAVAKRVVLGVVFKTPLYMALMYESNRCFS